MRNSLCVIVVLPILALGACGKTTLESPPPPPPADGFAFALMADSRGGSRSVERDGGGGINRGALTKALDHFVASGRGKLVLFDGDTVQGGTTADRLKLQLADWNALVEPYRQRGLEFLITSGNHEIDDGSRSEYAPSRFGNPTPGALANQQAMLAAFPGLPPGGPPDGGFTYFTRRGDALLIVLDSYRPGHFHQLDTAWLQSVLTGPAMQPRPSHVFVMTHAPAFPIGGHELDSLSNCNVDRALFQTRGRKIWPWTAPGAGGPLDVDVDWRPQRDALWALLAEHGVTAFLGAHEHNLSRLRVDGVWQIVSGALSNQLYPINDLPLQLYDGHPHPPAASGTVWGAKKFGYWIVSITDGKARAEAFGWDDDDAPVALLDAVDLD